MKDYRILLFALTVFFSLWAVMSKKLLTSAIMLALVSVTVSLIFFDFGAPWAGVFELSVCAGLVVTRVASEEEDATMIGNGATTSVVLLAVFMVLSAFFSASEAALLSVQRIRIQQMVRTKVAGAARVARLVEHPHRLLPPILLGNNLANTAVAALAPPPTGTTRAWKPSFLPMASIMTWPVLNVEVVAYFNVLVLAASVKSLKVLYGLSLLTAKMVGESVRVQIGTKSSNVKSAFLARMEETRLVLLITNNVYPSGLLSFT